MDKAWFSNHVAYTMAKYGMSMCVLGMAEEFKDNGIAVNALWPRTSIHTAAMDMLAGEESAKYSRTPEIMADAAYEVLCRDPRSTTGQFLIDDDVLTRAGVTDLKQYACYPENHDVLMPDFFLDMEDVKRFQQNIGARTPGNPPAAEGSSSKSGGKIAGLFKKIEGSLSEDLVKKTNAIYLFNVSGAEAGKWFLDLKNGAGKCGQGEGPTAADATLTMDSNHFFDMFSGKYP